MSPQRREPQNIDEVMKEADDHALLHSLQELVCRSVGRGTGQGLTTEIQQKFVDNMLFLGAMKRGYSLGLAVMGTFLGWFGHSIVHQYLPWVP